MQYRDATPALLSRPVGLGGVAPRLLNGVMNGLHAQDKRDDRSVDVDGDTPLLWVLRDVLGMTGTKFGCGSQTGSSDTIAINEVRSL